MQHGRRRHQARQVHRRGAALRRAPPVRLTAVLAILCAAPGAAQEEEEGAGRSAWGAEKCAAYAAAWDQVLLEIGPEGLSAGFLRGNEAFIASGCREGRDICPEGAAELDVANLLTIAAMNMGAASTFLPFACRG